jgi:catechol 2,3-dioxygenase-like lactoylglutathione lyase family enzyme
MAFRIEHVHLKVQDPEKTAKFYIDNLGATPVDTHHGFRLNLHGLMVNITEKIHHQSRDQRYGIEHLALETDDIDATVAKLEADGARVLERLTAEIKGRKRKVCFIEGPDGIQLELVEM